MALADEGRQCALQRPGRVVVREALESLQSFAKWRWRHHITDAERWREHLGECPDIGDSPLGVEPGQRWQRWSVEAELAVVIVLHDQAVVLARPVQQREPPGEGE